MNIIKQYKSLKLIISNNLLQSIYLQSSIHYPNEYGGLLIGRYSEDLSTLYIEDSITLKSYTSSKTQFIREFKHVETNFNDLYANTGFYYIGEWHTHPDGKAWYSYTDLQAMIDITKDPDVNICNPILLILSISKDSLKEYNFFILNNHRLEIYE